MQYKNFRITQNHIDFLKSNNILYSDGQFVGGWFLAGRIYQAPWACDIEPWSCQRLGPYFNSLGAFSYSRSWLSGAANVGRYCAIGDNVRVLALSHPIDRVSMCGFDYTLQPPYGPFAKAVGVDFPLSDLDPQLDGSKAEIGNDVWIGNDVRISRKVTIGTGAIIASGSVVSKDVAPYTLVAGNPARPKKLRFSEAICERLLASEWWNYAFTEFAKMPTTDPERFIDHFDAAKAAGTIEPHPYRRISLHDEFQKINDEALK